MEKVVKILRVIGLLLTLAGFVLSLHFMFQQGGDNPSFLLKAMFTGWVSLPFILLLLIDMRSGTWTPPARLLLYAIMEGVAILSVVVYSGLVTFENVRPAFPFLVVPLFSLALIAISYLVARKMTAGNH